MAMRRSRCCCSQRMKPARTVPGAESHERGMLSYLRLDRSHVRTSTVTSPPGPSAASLAAAPSCTSSVPPPPRPDSTTRARQPRLHSSRLDRHRLRWWLG